jgi:hypothetical protein
MLALFSCTADHKSPIGFRLPEGDAEQGLAVLQEMKCHTCHRVQGHDLPEPVADPPVPIVLGGKVAYSPTDGELVTSIINPSHKISSRYAHDMLESGNLSRMGDYSETLTVRQMIDLVAFLHTLYEPSSSEMRERGTDWRMTSRRDD